MCGGSVAFLSDYFDHLLHLQGGPESVHFSVHHIYGTIQDKMTWHGFHQNVQRSHDTKDLDAIFMQLLNILCKLAHYYYTNKMFVLTVQFMSLSPKQQIAST